MTLSGRNGLPHGEVTRKVLYNSWEATTFDVDVDSQIQLAKIAARMGLNCLCWMTDGSTDAKMIPPGWGTGGRIRSNSQMGYHL